MNPSQLTRLTLAVLLFISCADRSHLDDELGADAVRRMTLPELSRERLAPAVSLTSDYFRRSYPHLSAEAWRQKWTHAQSSGLMFMRSFVNTWYDELARVSTLGPIGPCFGDPHPENFGFLPFASARFVYTYNDFDDSGLCPVAFDALRYFTTLKLYVKDAAVEAELRRAYVHFLNGEELIDRPSGRFMPDAAVARAKVLSQVTKKNQIKRDAATRPVSPDKAKALFAVLKNTCGTCTFLDAAEVLVNAGGSAGLERYWVLVQSAETGPQLIEFKQQIEPASERGPWAKDRHRDRAAIMDDVWGKDWPQFYALVVFDQKNFLLRSRLKGDLELGDLSADQRKSLLIEQVYLLAQLHKKTLVGSGLLEEWLGRQSEFQAKRYGEALMAAKGG